MYKMMYKLAQISDIPTSLLHWLYKNTFTGEKNLP